MWWLFLLLGVAHAYTPTNDLLARVESECAAVEHLSCVWHDDLLVVDWHPEKPRDVLWTFNEHARERITGELALEMIVHLKEMQPTRRITILPVVNAWGRRRVEEGHYCQRKNKHGVDTNRNYPPKRHHYPLHSEEYEGPAALSEPETKYIASLLRDGTRMFINIHSGEFSLYTPWDAAPELPPNFQRLDRNVRRWSKWCPQCAVGPAARTSFYKAYGTSVDYATTLGIDAYTFEIFGRETMSCAHMFNPEGAEKEQVLTQWKRILKESLKSSHGPDTHAVDLG